MCFAVTSRRRLTKPRSGGVFCYLQFSTKREQPLNFPLLKNFPLSPL
ncbi:hypothetical protein SD15574_4881 [Shigella dysenteriae 155-74]|nr:hypothetical protein Sd1012_5058 [Shigella dysenteriae 1012]EGI89627.1 hypothetical protein SD15574_4881 [Shigella dysenteriae 155-74]